MFMIQLIFTVAEHVDVPEAAAREVGGSRSQAAGDCDAAITGAAPAQPNSAVSVDAASKCQQQLIIG